MWGSGKPLPVKLIQNDIYHKLSRCFDFLLSFALLFLYQRPWSLTSVNGILQLRYLFLCLQALQNIRKLSCYFMYGIIGNPTSAWSERMLLGIVIKGTCDFSPYHHRLPPTQFTVAESTWEKTETERLEHLLSKTILEYTKTGCSNKPESSLYNGWEFMEPRAREVR